MKHFLKIAQMSALLVLLTVIALPVYAADPVVAGQANLANKEDPAPLPDRVLGKADAPIRVDEFVSLTCSHCGEFYTETLPVLEKRYVDTGKVKFVLHDFVMDGPGLRAAVLARCMPADEFYPFISILYKNQQAWALSTDPQTILISYAKLGGLPEDQAKKCLADTKLQDSVVAERTMGEDKYKVEATPTFIVNDGAETIAGAQPVEEFAKVFDKLLAAKK